MGVGAQEHVRSRGGAYLLLAAAILLAAIMIWRTLDDAGQGQAQIAQDNAPPTIAELRQHASANPDDAQGWQQLGYALFAQEQYADAAAAYDRAVAADPNAAVLWSALAEARIYASDDDPMPATAIAALERAIALDPADARARYFLAVRRDLRGDHEGAIEDWLALLKDTPQGAPWEDNLIRTIDQVGKINRIATADRIAAAQANRQAALADVQMAAPGIPGPSQAQIAAAGALSPAEQDEMARGMVARLEGRLDQDPSNIDGWIMLMRSRMALGQADLARQALARAIAANPDYADNLRQQAAMLGLR